MGLSTCTHNRSAPCLTALESILPECNQFLVEIELLNIHLPESYERNVWEYGIDETLLNMDELQERAKSIITEKQDYENASLIYSHLINIIDFCRSNHTKYGTYSLSELDASMMKNLLNDSLCQLKLKKYQNAIKRCNMVLEMEPSNEKALFRRAQANRLLSNLTEARIDITNLLKKTNSPDLIRSCQCELEQLKEISRLSSQSNAMFRGLFSSGNQ